MKIATAVSDIVGRAETGAELVARIQCALGGGADLCLLFCSAEYIDELDRILPAIHDGLQPRVFLGSSADSVIAADTEYEGQAALTVWAARLPNVRLTSFHLSHEDIERLREPEALREHLGLEQRERPYFVLLGDPYTLGPRMLEFLDQLEGAYPGRPALGGLASSGQRPGENAIVFDGHLLRHGLAGVALTGDVHIDTVVSQGCRPIGRHYVVTRAEQNVIYQLGGKPTMDVVSAMLKECPEKDLSLARTGGLLLGRVINEYQPSFARGDFLIRNPIGFDPNTKALAVNDFVRTGQTVQFHVRDGDAATEDLRSLLGDTSPIPAAGALLFSCNGRGTRLFSDESHDARAVHEAWNVPLAGFFCAGEIGPVGNRNFLHGHTASVGLFRPSIDPSS